MTSRGGSGDGHVTSSSNNHQQGRFSRMNLPVPSLIRRLTTRSSNTATQSRTHTRDVSDDMEVDDGAAGSTPTRRRRPFSSLGRNESRRFSYIHQETVTTISDRNTAYSPLAQHDMDGSQEPHELEVPSTVRAPNRLQRHRRMSWSFSNQMSNFFANMTVPGRSMGRSLSRLRVTTEMLIISTGRLSHRNSMYQPRSRMSAHEPIAELGDNDDNLYDRSFRPPTPAAYRSYSGSQENTDEGDESEYERGYTPRRRRHRPRPVVGEPHDEDYIQRRRESDRRARRATWGPTNNPYSLRESSMESLDALGRTPPPPAELPGSIPTRLPSLFSRSFANVDSELPDTSGSESRPTNTSPSMFRPALALRQLCEWYFMRVWYQTNQCTSGSSQLSADRECSR